MAAYGLYTHIASNKIKSMFLLAGLFLLIYVMVFAGALIAEVFLRGTNRTVAFYLTHAWHDLIVAFPWATAASALWIVIAVGEESNGNLAQRGGEAAAERLGQEAVQFPGDHGGFMGGEYGQPPGKPVEFARKLREVLAEG